MIFLKKGESYPVPAAHPLHMQIKAVLTCSESPINRSLLEPFMQKIGKGDKWKCTFCVDYIAINPQYGGDPRFDKTQTKSNLVAHLTRVHFQKKVRCLICDDTFGSRQTMLDHCSTHKTHPDFEDLKKSGKLSGMRERTFVSTDHTRATTNSRNKRKRQFDRMYTKKNPFCK